MRLVMFLISFVLASTSFAAQPKEWTFLLYLNGNNNLDSFGAMNLNQIEKVGSTDRINIVVQWASLKNGKTVRMLMQKDGNEKVVSSPILQDLGKADMGDWHTLVDFVKWGSLNFPAQHYFVDVWDHGSGWHSLEKGGAVFKDISTDDTSGNHMTTLQLAQALYESAKAIGHKIDIYASDACLMGMIEIASEVAPAVILYAGSEDLEPGKGWPYDQFFTHWNQLPAGANAKEVVKILSRDYAKSYELTRSSKVTFSAFDLSALPAFQKAISNFAVSLRSLTGTDFATMKKIAKSSQQFYNSDYVDFLDFMNGVKTAQLGRDPVIYTAIEQSAKKFIVANNTVGYPRANGVSIWIPAKARIYSEFAALYSQLNFDRQTRWSELVKLIAE